MLEHRNAHVYDTLSQTWFEDEAAQIGPWLDQLDRDPGGLLDYQEANPTRLLGKRFEHLVRFWLENHSELEVLEAGTQLKQGGKTVGELDFVFQNTFSGEWYHMEVACKFYLGYNNSRSWSDWKGPNASDTLKLKMDKLADQLSIFDKAHGKAWLEERRLPRPRSVLMLKGYLFHHFSAIHRHKSPTFSNPNYPAGFWCWLHEISQVVLDDSTWTLLPKQSWLAPVVAEHGNIEVYSGMECRRAIAQAVHQYKRGVMVVRLQQHDHIWREVIRGFVVPNAWPGR